MAITSMLGTQRSRFLSGVMVVLMYLANVGNLADTCRNSRADQAASGS
jgi:hypothetical protein